MITLGFTYDKVTPESAEYGDTSDHGFYGPGGYFYSMNVDHIRADILANKADYSPPWKPGDLRQAIHTARDLGIYEDSGRWFDSRGEDTDYSTGETTRYAFHPDGVTPSTYRRIARLLKGK